MTVLANILNYLPLCSQTSSTQYNSCSQAPWFYIDAPKHYGKQGYPPLEEIHPGYSNGEHSWQNGYEIPDIKKSKWQTLDNSW